MTTTSSRIDPAEAYARGARAAGCPKDQWLNLVKARIVFQPKQLQASAAARLCDWPDGPTKIGFGGSRGSAKSHWGLTQVVADDCTRYPGLKFLYLRKVGKSGREAIQDLRRQVLHSIPHEYRIQEGRIVLPNESSLIVGHYRTESDIDKYLGLEYDGSLIEEATQLTSRKIKDIGTCVRSSKPGWRPRQYFTSNPGNVGHAWFKRMFIEPMRAGTETDTRFIQAFPWDNKFLNPEYLATLDALTGWQRRAWRDGDWDLAAGQFFTNFRREAIVRDLGVLPDHWRAWLGFDYGFTHYTSVHLFALNDDGHLWAVDEHAERGWLPDQHAEAIKGMLRRHGRLIREDGEDHYLIEGIDAGLDAWNRDRTGTSTADAYADLGIRLDRADVDRINGAAEILRRLGSPDADPPRPPTLSIDPRCARLIECLPSLERDPNRPEDVLKADCDEDGLGGDDFYDSARYACMHAAIKPSEWGDSPFGDRRF